MNRGALALVLLAIAGCSSAAFSAGDGGGALEAAAAGDAGDVVDARELDQVVDQVEPLDAAGDVVDAAAEVVLEAAAAADVVDACAPAPHSDGFGQSFADCTPAGDYTEQLAVDACEAFTKGTAGAACTPAACPEGPLVVCTSGLPSSCACWVYGGSNVGHAREGNTPNDCPCGDMVAAGATTGWQ